MTQLARLKASDVMRRDLATLSPDDSIETAIETFEDSRIGGAAVVDSSGHLVGVLTLSDVARTDHVRGGRVAVQSGGYELSEPVGEEQVDELDPCEVFFSKEDYSAGTFDRQRVADWMTRGAVSVAPDTSLREVCKAMLARSIHRVFVTDGPKLVGVISSFDVVRCVARGA